MKKLNILFVSTELAGLVSTGGLGEAVAGLSRALSEAGHEVRIIMPYYALLNQKTNSMERPVKVWEQNDRSGRFPDASVFQTKIDMMNKKIIVYLVKGHIWFDQVVSAKRIYSPDDRPEPYFFLSATILDFLSRENADWLPDIIHCHEYHTGLLPVYLKTVYGGELTHKKIGTVFTIHNLAFQGRASKKLLHYGGLPSFLGEYSGNGSSMEFHGKINCMKGALNYADISSTVSKTYAVEIMTPRFGNGLEGVLTALHIKGRLKGITNGIDGYKWNPMNLQNVLSFSSFHPEGKTKAKKILLEMCGMKNNGKPVILIKSRWAYQKGIELLLYALQNYHILENAHIILITSNIQEDPSYEFLWDELKKWESMYPDRIALRLDDHSDTQLYYAGSDMCLIPSLYEPCGLVQMEAMRYGAVPIVHSTGGLTDTVSDSFGFKFEWSYREPLDSVQKSDGSARMMEAVNKALNDYHNSMKWNHFVHHAMMQHNEWINHVPEYMDVYQAAIKRAEVKK